MPHDKSARGAITRIRVLISTAAGHATRLLSTYSPGLWWGG